MRQCVNCGSGNTYTNRNGWVCWYKYKDGYLCHNCYQKIINYPRWRDRGNKQGLTRILFGNKRIYLKDKPRTGKCSKCENMGLTHIHHEKYDSDNPLLYTIELCPACHALENPRQRNSLGQFV